MNTSIILAGYIALLLVLSFILIRAANLTVSAAHALIQKSHSNKYGLAVFFVALAQCLPELLIALVASVNKNGQMAVASVIGSNIANVSLILGGAALVAGSIKAVDSVLKKEIAYVVFIAALPPLFLLDNRITRVEGALLLTAYAFYEMNELQKHRHTKTPAKSTQLHIKRLLVKLTTHTTEKKFAAFLVGTLLMVGISQAIILVTQSMAGYAHIPIFLITLIIVSIGTCLPELVFEIIAIKRKETSMAFASVLGAIVTDSTLTLGLAALVFPIALGAETRAYLMSMISFIIIFGLFWRFVWTKHRLDRLEGAVLMGVYVLFAVVQYLL